jgi:hypothetical protein
MAETKTKPTKVSVKGFIAKVPNDTRRKDAEALLELFEKVSGWKPKMWGPTIVGFGKYSYTYDSGHSGEMCVIGFSPRGSNLVIYGGAYPDDPKAAAILKTLGKHKSSKACVYINKLSDVDTKALEKLLTYGLSNFRKTAKEKGWLISAS